MDNGSSAQPTRQRDDLLITVTTPDAAMRARIVRVIVRTAIALVLIAEVFFLPCVADLLRATA